MESTSPTGVMEINRFTVKPEAVAAFLAGRPAMLEAVRRHFPGFVSAHLARLEGNVWVDVAFWESVEQCRSAVEHAIGVPEIAAWLALIDEDLSMESGVTEEVPVSGRHLKAAVR